MDLIERCCKFEAGTEAVSFPLELDRLPKLAQLGSFGPNKTYSKVELLVPRQTV